MGNYQSDQIAVIYFKRRDMYISAGIFFIKLSLTMLSMQQ